MQRSKAKQISQDEILMQQYNINSLSQMNEDFFKENGRYQSYFIQTFGCQMNEHDSENLAGMFDMMNIDLADSMEEADIIIFNTCAVRENAELKVYGNLHALKKLKVKNPDLIIAVCGCMMQQDHVVDEIKKRFPHVSLVFGTHNLYKFPELLLKYLSGDSKTLIDVWDIDGNVIEGLPSARRYDLKAFVNIMYGCNNFCTYCIVPYTRGRERSRNPEDVINEVKDLARNGVKEITLLGQNVNSYGNDFDNKVSFAKLLTMLNDIQGIERIRFMTSHPKDISEELIDAVANLDKVCESIHLPVQSGSTAVLKKMNRHYTKDQYIELINKIKTKVPNVALTTDIMVGFPGETEEDFLDTLDVLEKVQYDSAFMFIYSVRKGTVAENMDNHIDESVKKDRFNRLLSKANEIAELKNSKYMDEIVEVLVEGFSKKDKNRLMGRTRQNKLVNFIGDESMIGSLVNVKVTETKSFSLNGIALD